MSELAYANKVNSRILGSNTDFTINSHLRAVINSDPGQSFFADAFQCGGRLTLSLKRKNPFN